MHPNSQHLMGDFVHNYLDRKARLAIADVGAYDVNGTYRHHFDSGKWRYVGMDIRPGPNVDYVLPSLKQWNLPKEHLGAYDVVVSGQTLEHVAQPWVFIEDLKKLAKPDALIWITAPNTEIYHEHPIDCWRVWPEGMRGLAEWAGLKVVECFSRGDDTTAILIACGGQQTM